MIVTNRVGACLKLHVHIDSIQTSVRYCVNRTFRDSEADIVDEAIE